MRQSGTAKVLFFAVVLLFISGAEAFAYVIKYKEEYYSLYHTHYNQYPDEIIENIYYLEKALNSDFCNPLYALALIENETEWEKYRYLFMMHINLKLTEQYLRLGEKWNKRKAYFYNAPWKEQNIKSLETAESCFNTAKVYWLAAVEWKEKTDENKKFRFMNLQRVQYWEDEAYRMENKSLDYAKIIDRELHSLNEVRKTFESFNEDTY
jgi:hypothetical protein